MLVGLESWVERDSPSSREAPEGVQESCQDTAGGQGWGAESSSALLVCTIQPGS